MAEKKTWKDYKSQKDSTVRARMDIETVKQLDTCCEALNTTRSDVIRKGIQKIFDDVSKK